MNNAANILIVDDDKRNLRILEEILDDDYMLHKAESGEEALNMIDSVNPDTILLDIMMPGIDGLEVCRQVRQLPKHQDTKIILISGKAMIEERVAGYEAGADDYVTKPFDDEELLAKVKVFTKLKSTQEIDRLKTNFLSLITHETGTPLNHIIGISDLLLDRDLDEDSLSFIKGLRGAALELHDKIEKILLLSRVRQGQMADRIEMLVEQLVYDVIDMLGVQRDSERVKINIEEGVLITGDFLLLQKLLTYIIDNALKLTPNNLPIEILASKELVGGKWFMSIDVIDAGPGLSEDEIVHLFDAFYVNDLLHHKQGLNISLALCEQIVALHSGKIKATNNDDAGLTVNIRLPC